MLPACSTKEISAWYQYCRNVISEEVSNGPSADNYCRSLLHMKTWIRNNPNPFSSTLALLLMKSDA